MKRSCGHSFEQFTIIDYSTNDQVSFLDVTLVKQLNDIVISKLYRLSQRKCKNPLSQMFTIETALIKKTLVEWFNKKNKSQHLALDLLENNQYERKHPID